MAAVIRLAWRLAGIALAVMLAVTPALPVHAQGPSEYQVKAAYLYSFGRFVEWPANAPPTTESAFVVCLLGDDPFGPALDEVAANGVVKDKPVRIQRLSRLDDDAACHTLFIGASEDVRLGKVLQALGHRPVLTVSDAPQFAQRGGMIGFSLEGKRVRFTVNLAAAQEAGLLLNSELLRVAAAILRTRQPRP